MSEILSARVVFPLPVGPIIRIRLKTWLMALFAMLMTGKRNLDTPRLLEADA
jgi:hypothetical protein